MFALGSTVYATYSFDGILYTKLGDHGYKLNPKLWELVEGGFNSLPSPADILRETKS